MIEPVELFRRRLVPVFVFEKGARKRGFWARSEGILKPFVRADRLGQGQPGWSALCYHESLHCVERHAFVAFLVLMVPATLGLVAVAVGFPWSGYSATVLGWLLWLWWKREAEVRADAFAWRGAGPLDFYALMTMLPHPVDFGYLPAGWMWLSLPRRLGLWVSLAWYRWLYGRTVEDRVTRARERAERTRWKVSESGSKSSGPTAASSSTPTPKGPISPAPGPSSTSPSSKAASRV